MAVAVCSKSRPCHEHGSDAASTVYGGIYDTHDNECMLYIMQFSQVSQLLNPEYMAAIDYGSFYDGNASVSTKNDDAAAIYGSTNVHAATTATTATTTNQIQ